MKKVQVKYLSLCHPQISLFTAARCCSNKSNLQAIEAQEYISKLPAFAFDLKLGSTEKRKYFTADFPVFSRLIL